MIIAIDFDNTCVKSAYPAIGEEMPNCADVLRRLAQRHKLILHTCRRGEQLDAALGWFLDRDIPISIYKPRNEIKVFADIYIDDRNLLSLPKTLAGAVDWLAIERTISKARIESIYKRIQK